ncbi:exosortase F system-associated membrane protein [Urechidicola croceus]|uniref:Exosortase F system-associated protein n=1 Tax=Urechidicola croceus TaxID=1850246 RepID=A0A1D8PAU2_9FLAO|nr:exosortase F system-associated protein [Urechidicola croceus]AOW21661.1 exosortase F system-associated protein [Urechidicola croceus]
MKKRYRIVLIILLFVLLVTLRAVSSKVFYDPFIEFFKLDYLTANFPDFNSLSLFVHLVFRYVLNTLISLAVIYLLYMNKSFVLFSIKFYLIAFIVLSSIYFYELNSEFSNGYLFAFYVRRMLIHPIFLLILLPAFYYQNKVNNIPKID